MDRQAQIKADLEAYRASKQGVTSTLPVQKTGDIKADLEAYRASKQQAITPVEQPKTEKDNNMFQKLFVNTIGRAGDSLARVIALGGAKVADTVGKKEYGDKLRDAALDPTPLTPLPVINATVEGQKAFGEGGGKQLAINTGKTALDIATIGEGGAINAGLKELGAKALPKLAKSKLGRGAIGTVANVTEGVGYNTAYNALNEKPLTENAGIAGVASAVLPPVIQGVARGLAPKTPKQYVAKVLKNTGKKNLSSISSNKELDKAVGGFNVIRENAPNIIVKDADDIEKVFDPNKATFFELPQALQQTKQAVYKEYSDIAREAGERGVDFSQKEFDELKKVLDKYQGKGYTPAFSTKARQFQEALDKFDNYATPEEVQSLIEKINLDVNPLSDKAGSQVANEFSQEIRRLLDDKLEKSGNPAYQATRDKYVQLKSIEKDIIARYKEALRKANANPGLIDGISTIDGIMGIVKGDPTQVLRAGLIQVVKKAFNYLRDPEVALQNAFKALEKSNYKSIPLPGIQAKANTKNNIANNINISTSMPKIGKLSRKDLETGFVNSQSMPNDLISEAKKYKSAEEFVKKIKGSATQYGDYFPKLRKYGMGDYKNITELGIEPDEMVTIYRGIDDTTGKIPKKINDGDFVTTDYDSAWSYAGDNKVVSMEVPAKTLYTDAIDDFKSDPFYTGSEYVYTKEKVTPMSESKLTEIWKKANSKDNTGTVASMSIAEKRKKTNEIKTSKPKTKELISKRLIRNQDGSASYMGRRLLDAKDMTDKEVIDLIENTPF